MRICPTCHVRDTDPDRTACVVCGQPLVEATDPLVGTVLGGRYHVEGVIGEGGMATVYRARHTLMERPYAVKVMRRELASDEQLVERMRREGRSTAALSHPNIVEIYDFGMTDEGSPYLVMELLDGEPLRKLLERGKLARPLLLRLAMQIVRGLARAHDFGIVHRDLKPENVFVCRDEHGAPLVKIVDFGIARSPDESHLTKRGEVVGTPQYIAPERVMTRDVGPSSDLYSFGVVLFEMATGILPFESNSPTGFVLKHVHEAPKRARDVDPSVPEDLDALIADLMRKDPAERPVDAHQVLERLQALADEEAPTPRPTQPPEEERTEERTVTLDAWATRADLLAKMLERAHPDGRPPAEQVERLARVRADVKRLRELREEGVKAQRELDALSKEQRETSERLGHAVHVLARDLSRARDEARRARSESAARAAAAAGAEGHFLQMLEQLEQLTETRPGHQAPELLQVSRSLADAAEAWQRADEAATRSIVRAGRSDEEVQDLEFQVAQLGDQLHQLDLRIGERGASSREALEANHAAKEALTADMTARIRELTDALRGRPELEELFVALDGTDGATLSV